MNLLSRWDFSYLATVCQFETISFPISLQLGGVSCCFVVSLPSFDLQHRLQGSLLQYQKSQPMHRDTWCVCSRTGGFETLQQERIGGLWCVCSWSFPRWPGSFLFLGLQGMNTQEKLPALSGSNSSQEKTLLSVDSISSTLILFKLKFRLPVSPEAKPL